MRVAEGRYVAKVTEWALGLTSNEKLVFHVFISLIGRPDPERPDVVLPLGPEVVDREAKVDIYFSSEKAQEMSFKKLDLLGFKGGDLRQLHPGEPDAHDFTDAQVVVRASDSEYNGKVYSKFDIDLPFAKRAKKDLTTQAVADLDTATNGWAAWQERQRQKSSVSPSQIAGL
jgi:hypothetical protein